MKALSVRQPWAVEINDGLKNIEFRSRSTNVRGKLLICASKSERGLWLPADSGLSHPLPIGCMMCVVDLVDCRAATQKDFDALGVTGSPNGHYAWVFDEKSGETVQPVAVNGSLGFFNVDDSLIKPIPEGKFWYDYDYPNKGEKPPKVFA